MLRDRNTVEEYLTAHDLAGILKLSAKTVQNRMSCNPASLPPRSLLPNVQGARWASHIVREWQARYDPATAEPAGKKRRGRPSKAQEVERRQSAAAREG